MWNVGNCINKIGLQGEWEGNTVDIVLGAMRAFPHAAFLGISHSSSFLSYTFYKFSLDRQGAVMMCSYL